MKFHPHPFVSGIVKTVGMASETVLLPHIPGDTTVAHQDHHLMKGFRGQAPKVPHCCVAA